VEKLASAPIWTAPLSNKPRNGSASLVRPRESSRKPAGVEDIRLLAYRKWEQAGRPPGDGVEFWLAAEAELEQAT
jgi:hypothetical protein